MLNRSLALTRQMHRQYPISQIELWQQPGLVAGIDLTLLIEKLRLSPEERVRRMHDAANTAEQVRGAARLKRKG